MFEILPVHISPMVSTWNKLSWTHAKTFENSDDGDITKLSFVLDHEIKCWMLWSSSMLGGH